MLPVLLSTIIISIGQDKQRESLGEDQNAGVWPSCSLCSLLPCPGLSLLSTITWMNNRRLWHGSNPFLDVNFAVVLPQAEGNSCAR